MSGILEWLGSFGAGVVQFAIGIGSIIGAIWVGSYAMKVTRNPWIAWAAGIGTLVITMMIMAPTYSALKRVGCHTADDYGACMNDDDDPDGN
jgi:hypothetical protein